jgi:hypothetical protein
MGVNCLDSPSRSFVSPRVLPLLFRSIYGSCCWPSPALFEGSTEPEFCVRSTGAVVALPLPLSPSMGIIDRRWWPKKGEAGGTWGRPPGLDEEDTGSKDAEVRRSPLLGLREAPLIEEERVGAVERIGGGGGPGGGTQAEAAATDDIAAGLVERGEETEN